VAVSADPHLAEADLEFRAIARSVSIQIHKINANVSAITKLVDLLGSAKDSSDLRTKLSVPGSDQPPAAANLPRHQPTNLTLASPRRLRAATTLLK